MSGSRQNTDTEDDASENRHDDDREAGAEIDESDESRLENRWEANPKVQ